ncbi:hypothetical protein KCU65_g4790, partial [Aureobasidium melanogenum]
MLRRVLFLVLTLFGWVNAIAPGQLGIQLDEELTSQYYFVYKSYVVFNENVQTDWTPEQFVGLAEQAYADMIALWRTSTADMKLHKADLRRPRVMTAIAIGNTVSFSSSAKGRGKSIFYVPTLNGKSPKNLPAVLSAKAHQCAALAQALRRCSTTAPGSDEHMIHTNSANCGEEWAAYQYCLEHPDADFKGARVVAWENNNLKFGEDAGPDGPGTIKDPCPQEGLNFGCSRLVKELEMDVIPKGTASDLTRDPGTISCTYPSFCNAPS